MTLPMLTKNYQFFIRQQQFKKAYAALNIAVQKTQIDMGEGVRCYVTPERNRTDCDYFFHELAKNLQILKTCNENALANGCLGKDFRGGDIVYSETQGSGNKEEDTTFFTRVCTGFTDSNIKNVNTVYVVNSGFSIIPYGYSVEYFLLDINGLQGPNKWGYDIFVFRFDKRKKTDSVFYINPNAGCHPLDHGGIYTKHFVQYLYGQNSEGYSSTHQRL